jgi:hypothetical protein
MSVTGDMDVLIADKNCMAVGNVSAGVHSICLFIICGNIFFTNSSPINVLLKMKVCSTT